MTSRPQVRAIGVDPTTHGGVTASVWIHSTSSPSQRLVRSTTVVHQHKERAHHTVDGHGQAREDDLRSFVIELESPWTRGTRNLARFRATHHDPQPQERPQVSSQCISTRPRMSNTSRRLVTTQLEGDEKLPKMVGLQLLKVQEQSLFLALPKGSGLQAAVARDTKIAKRTCRSTTCTEQVWRLRALPLVSLRQHHRRHCRMKDVEQEGGRSPRKQEMRILQLVFNQPTAQHCALSSHTDNSIPEHTANNDNGVTHQTRSRFSRS